MKHVSQLAHFGWRPGSRLILVKTVWPRTVISYVIPEVVGLRLKATVREMILIPQCSAMQILLRLVAATSFQLFPKIAVDQAPGNSVIAWHGAGSDNGVEGCVE